LPYIGIGKSAGVLQPFPATVPAAKHNLSRRMRDAFLPTLTTPSGQLYHTMTTPAHPHGFELSIASLKKIKFSI
jgi:hypothetical protein